MGYSTKDRTFLKQRFTLNAVPSMQDYHHLIDAMLVQADDGIVKSETDPLVIEAKATNNPRAQLIRFYKSFENDPDASWLLEMKPRAVDTVPSSAADGLSISNAAKKSLLFMEEGPEARIGMGTLSPTAKLHIVNDTGNVWRYNDLEDAVTLELGKNGSGQVGSIKMHSYDPNQYVFMRPSNGNFHLDSTRGNYYLNWDTPGQHGVLHIGGGDNDHRIRLDAGGTSFMMGGYFGLGTQTPAAKLQVTGGAIMPQPGNDPQSGIMFPRDAFGGGGDAAWIRYYARHGEATTFEIGTANDPDDNMALISPGGIGINTNTPQAALDIHAYTHEAMSLRRTDWGPNEAWKVHTEGMGPQSMLSFSWENEPDAFLGLRADGKVGIGTPNPTSQVQITHTAPQLWRYQDLAPHVSLELGDGAAGQIGSLKLNSYVPGEFVFLRPSDGNMHLDSSTGRYYLNWDPSITNGAHGHLFLGDADANARVMISSHGSSYFTGGHVGIGTTLPEAALHVASGAIMPKAGNGPDSGILFPADPGGGSGDSAWMRYFARSGESTTLQIGVSNDGDDNISLHAPGGVGINTDHADSALSIHSPGNHALGLRRTPWAPGDQFRVNVQGNPGGEFLSFTWNEAPDYRFLLMANGNAGFGPNIPNAKLDVRDVRINGVTGRNYFKDEERNDGNGLRVGAAWNKYGIYAESGPVVVGGQAGTKLQDEHVTVAPDGRVTMGIGLAPPTGKLVIGGRVDVHQGPKARFNGLDAPTGAGGRAQLVLSSAYSDLVIASSENNSGHGSTLTFATYNPANPGDFRKFVFNQGNWGARRHFMDIGYRDGAHINPHDLITGGWPTLSIDGLNRRLGIRSRNPEATLDVSGVRIDGTIGRNFFKDIERHDGEGLRVGAVWGKYGIYAQNGPAVVGGELGVHFQNDAVAITPEGRMTIGSGEASPPGKFMSAGRMDLRRPGTPYFPGLVPETSANRGQFVLQSAYSDLVIASSQNNPNHGSTLTFASYNPANAGEYRKFVINQGNWGARRHFLEFGYSDDNGRSNPHSNINPIDTAITIDGMNKRLGVGTITPETALHVNGEIKTETPYMTKGRGSFKVDGSYGKWYPVVIMDRDWSSGNLEVEITRTDIHTDSQWRGSLVAKLTHHSSRWGHGSEYWAIKTRQSNGARFINGVQNVYKSGRVVIWLRGGGTTYFWHSNHRMEVNDFTAVDSKIVDGQTNNPQMAHSRTTVAPSFNKESFHLDSHGLVSNMPRGMIMMWNGSVAPAGWALCDGTNGTPDLRGRFVLGAGNGSNLSARTFGQTGGVESVGLSVANLPAHSHTLNDPGHFHTWSASRQQAGTDDNNNSRELSRGDRGTDSPIVKNTDTKATGITVNNTGDGTAHENMPPYIVLSYVMKL